MIDPAATWGIARKDLRLRLRDRSAVIVAFVAPLALAAILSLALGDADAFDATYAVANADSGPVAAGFVPAVQQATDSGGTIDFERVGTVSEARAAVSDGDADAAFVIPSGFSDAVMSGRAARLEVLRRNDVPISGEVAESIAEAYAAEVDAVRLAVQTAVAGAATPPGSDAIARLGRAASGGRIPISVVDDSAGGREVGAADYFAPAMAIFFVFFTVGFGAAGFLSERREGTLSRLLAAPITPATILVGKISAVFALGALSITVMVFATSVLLGARWGNPLGVGAVVVAVVFAAMGIVALAGTLARTEEQARGFVSIAATVLGLLGGNFIPITQAPEIVQQLSLLTPNGWAIRGFVELSATDGGIGEVVVPIAAICAFGAVTSALALVFARRVVTV